MKRIVLGPRAVTEALRAHASELTVVYVAEDARRELVSIAELARTQQVATETRSQSALDVLAKGERHQGVIAVAGGYSYVNFEELLASAPPDALLIALDELTDPHNFGAIVRSAVAFGAYGIITLKQRAAPVTPVVVRASAGATEHARIARVTNLAQTLSQLQERDHEVIGLAGEATLELAEAARNHGPRTLVVGSEGYGLRRLVRERCSVLARIPMRGPIASLNASVAAGIALYELSRGAA